MGVTKGLPPATACIDCLDSAVLPDRAYDRGSDDEDTVGGRELAGPLVEDQ